jgi:hypothetical protein
MRTSLLAEGTIYQTQQTKPKKQFTSASDLLRFRKAVIMSGTPLCTAGRPPQSAIVTGLIATGCQACQPVCEFTVPPIIFPGDLSGGDIGIPVSDVEGYLSEVYGVPITITAPDGYPYESFILLQFPPYCNATTYVPTLLVDGSPVSFEQISYGPSNYDGFPYEDLGIGGNIVIFPDVDLSGETDITVTLTASNSCSSSTGDAQIFCFLAGSPVAMTDGTTKPIEQVVVGDRVIGAFGETNTVTGTLSSMLGLVSVTNINGEHKTTAPHPHITADHKLACTDPVTLSKFAYGKSFPITNARGITEKRVIKGVNPERIVKLETGMSLQTLTGPRTVSTLESIRMPPNTRVYHLTTDGSHSYTVDGYAVAGGATEEDWDYDTWTPRSPST